MAESNLGINLFLKKLKTQFDSNIIMNWTSLHKCILILFLTIALQFSWIAWKVFIVLNPEIWQWVNISLIHSQLILNTASTILLFFLIAFCYFFQDKKWANTYLPHIVINIFIVLMLADGFLVGIYSPATVFAFVCISGLGLILFNRKIIYIQLVTALVIYISMMFLTYWHIIPYAPIFSTRILENNRHDNLFWVGSMLYFIVPILIVGLVLCEILLSQWRHRESLIKKLSETDPLTNLYNRRFFNEKLDAIQKAQTHYVIILIDIDHFKEINDLYGHHFGDEALCQVAQLLVSHIRLSDIVARYGGEEFIIALPETSLSVAQAIAERCRLAIQNQVLESLDHHYVQLTASFGIATSVDDDNVSKVIHLADKALYQAKQSGRNQVRLYHTPINEIA
ncbi:MULTISPECIES: GGDEF domain-containing protein [unclassified Acinetobacter]|uniref:GGDEF domain-containing protein n=1 Tax=unclassified Acinetobacter TaxID=196816 RepID=UPI0018AB80A6|nr:MULTISPECIES: GGDEF domain-containing protein [unclassified Acinetobacter]MBJ9951794.1 GGDEF domain-containing protein [Acinetobacter baumannii]